MRVLCKLTIIASLIVMSGASPRSASAQPKTAKDCNDELKANRAALKAAGETIREFIQSCWWETPRGTPTAIKTASRKPAPRVIASQQTAHSASRVTAPPYDEMPTSAQATRSSEADRGSPALDRHDFRHVKFLKASLRKSHHQTRELWSDRRAATHAARRLSSRRALRYALRSKRRAWAVAEAGRIARKQRSPSLAASKRHEWTVASTHHFVRRHLVAGLRPHSLDTWTLRKTALRHMGTRIVQARLNSHMSCSSMLVLKSSGSDWQPNLSWGKAVICQPVGQWGATWTPLTPPLIQVSDDGPNTSSKHPHRRRWEVVDPFGWGARVASNVSQ